MDFDCPGIESYFPRECFGDSNFRKIIDHCKEVVEPLLPMEGLTLDCIENEGYFSIDIYRLEFVNEEFLNKILEDPLNYSKYLGVAVLMLYKAYKESEAEEGASQTCEIETLRRLWFECTGYKEIIPIASISPPHYGKFVTISGMVASISKVTETVYEATFRCEKCSSLQYVLQPMGQFQTPKTCHSPNCSLQSNNSQANHRPSSITFSRLKHADIKVPSQIITVIQTRFDNKSNEKHVDVIQVQLLNHLIEKCFIMDSVTVSGIIVEPENIEGTGICSFYMICISRYVCYMREASFKCNR
ncbi:DNA helicase MCM8-like [Panonychus citri]|uniref:DNA helicase MCM8-like n=1 Tax=Panonychus citri TaxID=50023 RepID=UPI0023074BC1|nr:DNA helicase MCM8-like [Panonychus citri]